MSSTDPPGGGGPDQRRVGSLTSTVLRGVGLAGAGFALSRGLTLASYLVLARLVAPEEFGHFAAGMIVVGIGLLFTESGMLAALIHRRDRLEEAAATAVISTFAAGVGFSLLALALSPLIGRFFESDTVRDVAAALSGVLLLRSLSIVPQAILQRRFSFLRRLVAEPVGSLAFGAAAVIATANGMGVWGLVLGQYASGLVDVVLSWALVRWRPQMALASMGTWRELIGYGRHVFASNLVLRVGGQVPVALLGRFVGAAALGQFRYAMQLAVLPFQVLLAAGSYVFFPAFARIAEERERFRAAFLRTLRWMMVIAVPGGLLFLPLGESAALLVLGERWREAGHAAMALCLLTPGLAIISVVSEGMKANGTPRLITNMHLCTGVLGTIVMVALLDLDLVGVALGFTAGTVAGAVYGLRLAATTLEIPARPLIDAMAPALVSAGVMAGLLLPIDALVDPFSRGVAIGLTLLALEGLAGLAVYALMLRRLAPALGGELAAIVRAARDGRPATAGEEAAADADPVAAAAPGYPLST